MSSSIHGTLALVTHDVFYIYVTGDRISPLPCIVALVMELVAYLSIVVCFEPYICVDAP